MTRQLIEHLYDDIDGTLITTPEAGHNVTFSINRANYEIDLTTAHANELEANLTPFIKAARVVKRAHPSQRISKDAKQREAIRAWAKAAGFTVSDRGPIL